MSGRGFVWDAYTRQPAKAQIPSRRLCDKIRDLDLTQSWMAG